MASFTKSFRLVNFVLFNRNVAVITGDGRRKISKVGFVGLGNMGKPMAKNLLQKGYDVTVYDINNTISSSLSENGVKVANNLAELATDVECIITMLPNNECVLETYSENDGIIAHVKKGTVLVDSSTVGPQLPQTLSPIAEKKGATFLDAPVSGGVMAAQSGQLTFMVGGPKESAKLVDKLLNAMGRNVIYCGPTGSGQVAKICNNLVMAISMAGLSEAMNLGVRLGLDPKLLTSIINISTGRCWSSDVYNPIPGVLDNAPSSRNYQGGFSTKLLVKDLNLAKSAAEFSSSPTPLGNLTLKLYNKIIESGHPDLDFSVIYEFIQKNKSVNV